MVERGIAPVVGVALIVVITLLLASMFAVGAINLADLGTERETVRGLTEESGGASDTESHVDELIWAVDDGAGATTTHVVNYTIASGSDTAGNSLNSLTISYTSGSADVNGVDERSDVRLVGIDSDRDGTVDAVTIVDAFHHLPDQEAAIREAARVLAPGGALVVREFDPEHPLGRALVAAEHAIGMASRFRTPAALATAFDDAGLDPRIVDRGFGYTVAGVKREE